MKFLKLAFIITLIGCSSNDINVNQNISNPNSGDYNILFIGNSLTYYNNLPELVEQYASEHGFSVATTTVAKPGYAIVDHWADGEVQALIKTKTFDFVVIQQGPSSQSDGYQMLVNGGRAYAELCAANNARLAYFMVWPSLYNYHTFNGVIANYTAGATANNAILCPVGKVWKAYFEDTQDFSYYGHDGFHPSLEGSRVAAQVIVNALF